MSTKKFARIDYASGWKLIIPKEGNGPLLFMEWLALFHATQIPLQKVINNREDNCLEIRMICTNQIIHEAKTYINSNL